MPDDRFLVTFAGTHGIAQALPTVLEAAEQLRDEPVTFAFVGDGPVKDTLVRRARVRGLDNVVFHPQVPLEQVPAVLARQRRADRAALRASDLRGLRAVEDDRLHGLGSPRDSLRGG